MESEKALYEPIREGLKSTFSTAFGYCYLEKTANGRFSETIKKAVPYDIIFTFLKRGVSPDLVGFIRDDVLGNSIKDLITVEIKLGDITLQNIYQAKLYGDIFNAKYALLISPQPINEEIKRLQRDLSILGRFMSGFIVYIGQWQDYPPFKVPEFDWFPRSPFSD